jgi:CheY-like chemotaxis protein
MTDRTPSRIVIVDDDPRMLTAFARCIASWGLRCETYSDSRLALTAIERDPPDLLILDIFMPEPDGFEVIARMRRLSPELPIIAMSGDMIRDRPANALAMSDLLGVTATILKPVPPERLRALIAQTLPYGSADAALDRLHAA